MGVPTQTMMSVGPDATQPARWLRLRLGSPVSTYGTSDVTCRLVPPDLDPIWRIVFEEGLDVAVPPISTITTSASLGPAMEDTRLYLFSLRGNDLDRTAQEFAALFLCRISQ